MSGFSPALSRSLSTFVTAKTYVILWPVFISNSGVSLLKTCLGAPPLKMSKFAMELLQLEGLVGAGMEKLFNLELARRQPLRMMVAQEGLQRLAVRPDAVRPIIGAH